MEDLVKERSLRAVRIGELRRQIRPLRDRVALARLVQLLFRERPDVVHTHTAKAGTLGRVPAWFYNATRRRRHRCFVVHTLHGNVFTGNFGPTGTTAVRLVERMLACLTNQIVTISAQQEKDITTRSPASVAETICDSCADPDRKFKSLSTGSIGERALALGQQHRASLFS